MKTDKEFIKLIPPLRPEEYSQLEQSLIKDGCRDALVVWKGVLLDGHNRYAICRKHKLKYKTTSVRLSSRSEAKDWIDRNQLARRNLTPDQMTLLRGRIYNRQKKAAHRPKGGKIDHLKTSERLAEEFGVSESTIRKDANVASYLSEHPEQEQSVIKGDKTIKDVRREIKDKKEKETRRKERKKKLARLRKSGVDIKIGDALILSEKKLKEGTVDVIITDPPYPVEYIDCWSKLSRLSARVLKPSGFCVAYSGSLNLPEVIRRMSEHLDYYWMMVLLHSGSHQLITPRNFKNGYKPLLVFQKPPFKKLGSYHSDLVKGAGREKDAHEWQQAEGELKYVIEVFSKKGDIVLDPFCGTGTTLEAAKKLKRRAIGFDLKE